MRDEQICYDFLESLSVLKLLTGMKVFALLLYTLCLEISVWSLGESRQYYSFIKDK